MLPATLGEIREAVAATLWVGLGVVPLLFWTLRGVLPLAAELPLGEGEGVVAFVSSIKLRGVLRAQGLVDGGGVLDFFLR